MAVPTLPAPAMATFTRRSHASAHRRLDGRRRCRSGARARPTASFSTARWRTSPSWPTRSATSSRGTPARVTATRRDLAGHAEVAQTLARPGVGQLALDQDEVARWVGPLPDDGSRGAAGAAPGRSSTSRWPRWGCRGAGRSRPGGGRRCGPPRWGCRSSRGRSGPSGCSSCRRSSPRPGRRRCVGPGPVEVVAVEARAHDRGPGPVGGKAAEGTWAPCR